MKLSISMTRREVILGWILMVCHFLVLPVIAVSVNLLMGEPLNGTELNCLMFAVDFLLAVLIFHKFLGASAQHSFQTPFRCLRFAALGLIIYYAGSFLAGLVISGVSVDFTNVNDSNIYAMAQENYTLIQLCTILLVPVTEELLFRGLIFRPLQGNNRLIAYVLSTALFSAIHVVGYIGTTSTTVLLLCFLQYIPAGISLAWAYEKADSIWASILVHMTVNQISMSFMR